MLIGKIQKGESVGAERDKDRRFLRGWGGDMMLGIDEGNAWGGKRQILYENRKEQRCM